MTTSDSPPVSCLLSPVFLFDKEKVFRKSFEVDTNDGFTLTDHFCDHTNFVKNLLKKYSLAKPFPVTSFHSP
jgi:hypothetical protein